MRILMREWSLGMTPAEYKRAVFGRLGQASAEVFLT